MNEREIPEHPRRAAARLAGPDGESFVCTPPLRDPWHAEELWHGMATGTVHTVATAPRRPGKSLSEIHPTMMAPKIPPNWNAVEA